MLKTNENDILFDFNEKLTKMTKECAKFIEKIKNTESELDFTEKEGLLDNIVSLTSSLGGIRHFLDLY